MDQYFKETEAQLKKDFPILAKDRTQITDPKEKALLDEFVAALKAFQTALIATHKKCDSKKLTPDQCYAEVLKEYNTLKAKVTDINTKAQALQKSG